MTLLDLRQAGLDLEIAGSGDVDASEMIADRASLSVAGPVDIEVFIRSEVRARVAGSGDILVGGICRTVTGALPTPARSSSDRGNPIWHRLEPKC